MAEMFAIDLTLLPARPEPRGLHDHGARATLQATADRYG
jgi:hypothetical protein